MLTRSELAAALTGVWRLAHLDMRGFACFDASYRGFWRSFWAAALLAPAWLFLLIDQSGDTVDTGVLFLSAEATGYVVEWLAYALLALGVADLAGRSSRYFGYIVAYNWFQLVQALLWIPVDLLADTGLLPAPALGILWLICYAVLLGYNWFIARRGLDIPAGSALALVVIDLLLGLLIESIANSLALSVL